MTDYANCAPNEPWRATDIVITIIEDLTDEPILTVDIRTPAGTIRAMAEISVQRPRLILHGLHLQGINRGPLQFGAGNLRKLADAVMEELGCDEIFVEGTARTTGANPGNRAVFRFFRRIFPSR